MNGKNGPIFARRETKGSIEQRKRAGWMKRAIGWARQQAQVRCLVLRDAKQEKRVGAMEATKLAKRTCREREENKRAGE